MMLCHALDQAIVAGIRYKHPQVVHEMDQLFSPDKAVFDYYVKTTRANSLQQLRRLSGECWRWSRGHLKTLPCHLPMPGRLKVRSELTSCLHVSAGCTDITCQTSRYLTDLCRIISRLGRPNCSCPKAK